MKTAAQLAQSFFLNSGYVGTADIHSVGDLSLCSGTVSVQAVPQKDNFLFPFRQNLIHNLVQLLNTKFQV